MLRRMVTRLILQILVIVVVARVFGIGARAVGQPPVIGEMAGLALGPSLFGAWLPGLFAQLFPSSSFGLLQILSQVGVILFMFVVGLNLDWASVRKRAGAAIVISHVSIVVPFLFGVLAAFALYRRHAPAGVPFHAFALFMGIAMSITAFPVLARILEDRGLSATPIGSTAIACAAVDDVTAWTLLAVVVAVVTTGSGGRILAATLGLAAVYLLAMVTVVRAALRVLLAARAGRDGASIGRIAIVAAALFGSALATHAIGVHALFGAFVAGTVMPADDTLRRGLRERLEGLSTVVLLPLFFAFTGLRTQIGLLDDRWAWLTCLGIIALATIGTRGPRAAAARLVGMDSNSSLLLGALLNTRGLMELVALNVGYDLGVITAEMFTVLVLMALVTTALTAPLVDLALANAPSTSTTAAAT
jgi:Kef-type K+ transport system membrane component KefB